MGVSALNDRNWISQSIPPAQLGTKCESGTRHLRYSTFYDFGILKNKQTKKKGKVYGQYMDSDLTSEQKNQTKTLCPLSSLFLNQGLIRYLCPILSTQVSGDTLRPDSNHILRASVLWRVSISSLLPGFPRAQFWIHSCSYTLNSMMRGSELMASTALRSMAHKSRSLFPPYSRRRRPPPGSWKILSLWTSLWMTLCQIHNFWRKVWVGECFKPTENSNSAEKAFLRAPTIQFTSCKQTQRPKKELEAGWGSGRERTKARDQNSTWAPLREQ